VNYDDKIAKRMKILCDWKNLVMGFYKEAAVAQWLRHWTFIHQTWM